MANIYEVAKRAGVSTATVSRVLSRPQVVSPETRRRVLHAVKTMAYAPNSAAKNLRTLRTGKLLVTVPDISNPFFSLILQGIEDAAQREGHAVLFGDTQHDEKREERYALMLQRKEADGLIFLGHRLPKPAGDLVRSMAPACAPVVNGCEFNPRLRIPSVHIDNAAAAAEAMDHLYNLGHRRIGIVTGPLVSPLSRDRLRGATTRARAEGAEAYREVLRPARPRVQVADGARCAHQIRSSLRKASTREGGVAPHGSRLPGSCKHQRKRRRPPVSSIDRIDQSCAWSRKPIPRRGSWIGLPSIVAEAPPRSSRNLSVLPLVESRTL